MVAAAAVNNSQRSYQNWNNIAATPLDFNLDAGKYGLNLQGTAFGTATLQRYIPGINAYMPMGAAIAANGYAVYDLPAGQYQLTLAGGVSAVSGEIAMIARGGRF